MAPRLIRLLATANEDTMFRTAFVFAASLLATSACTENLRNPIRPAQFTRMSAGAHRAACFNHVQRAAAYDARARELKGGKGAYTAEYMADNERRWAMQHALAARAADPNLGDCPVPGGTSVIVL
jgi:hypothetical protein